MQLWFVFGSLFILFFGPLSLQAADLVYAPLPIESQEEVVMAHTPMVRYLEEKLGRTIRIHSEKNYETILRLFSEGKIDLVQLGPYPLATLREKYPATHPLVVINEVDGSSVYTCALVTSYDGPAGMEMLTGKLALPQELSTCATFAAKLLLKNHQPSFEQMGFEYLGNHSKVALAVTRGDFQAGVMKSSVAKKYTNLALRIMAETPPLPGFVIVGNQATLGDELAQKIGELLLHADQATRSSWGVGREGFSPFHIEELPCVQSSESSPR